MIFYLHVLKYNLLQQLWQILVNYFEYLMKYYKYFDRHRELPIKDFNKEIKLKKE